MLLACSAHVPSLPLVKLRSIADDIEATNVLGGVLSIRSMAECWLQHSSAMQSSHYSWKAARESVSQMRLLYLMRSIAHPT
jgi:hypothetical protein